eukprot:TRINITY_DN66474_c0_g1_i5.p4 TRINITY_DN66474_c0_g1~~TRINITY_DN66474_c0_g1_i5.p4  ORF type:complete len:128 (-),score=19.50 TRINITY_DN66474_c0_g1_i5:228-611(-)
MGAYALAKAGWGRWIIPDVAGIYIFLAAAGFLGGYISIRNLFFSPEVFVRKDTRCAGYPDDPDTVNAALNWKKSIFRSYAKLYNYTPCVYNDIYSYIDPATVREPPQSVIDECKRNLAENQKTYKNI